MKEKTFLDLFMESSMFAFPVVYLTLGGLVFYGGFTAGSIAVSAVVALVRMGIKR